MQNDGGNMKLFLRKYALVFLLGIILYSILFMSSINDVNYFNYYFVICLSYVILIRLFDDYLDYEKDLKESKNIFNKTTLLILICLFSTIFILFTFINKAYFLFILVFILIANLIKINILKYLKTLYIPLIIIGLSYYYFGFSVVSLILSVILFVVDLFLIIKG